MSEWQGLNSHFKGKTLGSFWLNWLNKNLKQNIALLQLDITVGVCILVFHTAKNFQNS